MDVECSKDRLFCFIFGAEDLQITTLQDVIYIQMRNDVSFIFVNELKASLGGKYSQMQKSNMTTLCYIEQDERYLMMHRIKKEHDVNRDKWVGVGGHFEKDESPEECLLREVREETGLLLTSYRLRGIITFISDRWQTEYMFLYTADAFEGVIGMCDEGELEWVDKKEVPKLPIWEGDKIFFRLLMQNVPFFSLKLRYEGDVLVECVLNGERMSGV